MATTQDQVQGFWGDMVPVLDASVVVTQDNVQGVWGDFVAVLDESSTPLPTFFPAVTDPIACVQDVVNDVEIIGAAGDEEPAVMQQRIPGFFIHLGKKTVARRSSLSETPRRKVTIKDG